MLRGAQKQMIVIRTHDSRLFEEAYFVVRKPRTGRPACKEANMAGPKTRYHRACGGDASA